MNAGAPLWLLLVAELRDAGRVGATVRQLARALDYNTDDVTPELQVALDEGMAVTRSGRWWAADVTDQPLDDTEVVAAHVTAWTSEGEVAIAADLDPVDVRLALQTLAAGGELCSRQVVRRGVAVTQYASPRWEGLDETLPTDRRIWERVRAAPGGASVRELAADLGLTQNAVRVHLRQLVDEGRVECHGAGVRGAPRRFMPRRSR